MLDRIKYRRQLRRLQRGRNQLRKSYDKDINQEQDEEEKHGLIAEEIHFIGEEEVAIGELQTTYLCREARKLMVPIPDRDDQGAWEDRRDNRYRYRKPVLTTKGMYDLNKKIRDERRERREASTFWIMFLFGLLGSLIGVLAFLRDILG